MKKVFLLMAMIITITLVGCNENSKTSGPPLDSSTGSSATATTEQPATTTKAPEASEPKINTDLLDDIGLTYPQLIEKRGGIPNELGNPYVGGGRFELENGYGTYHWNPTFEDLDEEGLKNAKCYAIEAINPEDLFLGVTLPASFAELEKTYEIECLEYESEIGMSNLYWASYSCEYENIEIVFATKERGVIDLSTSLVVRTPNP